MPSPRGSASPYTARVTQTKVLLGSGRDSAGALDLAPPAGQRAILHHPSFWLAKLVPSDIVRYFNKL